MIRLLVDQNFNGHILNGLTRRAPELDAVHLREVGLAGTPDPAILEWAAARERILLTHDRRTIPTFADARVTAGQPMPGSFLVSDDMAPGQAIDELLVEVDCWTPEGGMQGRR